MKYIFSFCAFLILLSFRSAGHNPATMQKKDNPQQDSIYSILLNTIDGAPVNLESFRGRKMLIIVLPLSAQDTSVSIAELNRIQTRYGDSLIVIGVPAEEFGYTASLRQQVKNLYSTQPAGFILAEGMKVKKTSGAGQSPLFQWLTDRNKNRYFNSDVRGTGHKFFVDESGRLYAVIGPQLALSNPVIEKILSK